MIIALFNKQPNSSNCSELSNEPNFNKRSTSSETKIPVVDPCLRDRVTTVMYLHASRIFPSKMASRQHARDSTSRCTTLEKVSSVVLLREGASRRGTLLRERRKDREREKKEREGERIGMSELE